MTQLDGETRVIDGNTFKVYMLNPMLSHELLMDMFKMVGPSIGPALDAVVSGSNANLDVGFFSRAASALFGGLDKATLNKVIMTMADHSEIDNAPLRPSMTVHFKGRLHVMYAWLAFAMEVQWGKSLSDLVNAIQAKVAKMKGPESQSQST